MIDGYHQCLYSYSSLNNCLFVCFFFQLGGGGEQCFDHLFFSYFVSSVKLILNFLKTAVFHQVKTKLSTPQIFVDRNCLIWPLQRKKKGENIENCSHSLFLKIRKMCAVAV